MSDRAYTVSELDALREACRNRYLWGRYGGGHGASRSYKEDEMYKATEEMVRTHMLAGHTADELIASDWKVIE